MRAYPHERLSALLDGHERAFRHFGGMPLTCLYDNPRTLVSGVASGRSTGTRSFMTSHATTA